MLLQDVQDMLHNFDVEAYGASIEGDIETVPFNLLLRIESDGCGKRYLRDGEEGMPRYGCIQAW